MKIKKAKTRRIQPETVIKAALEILDEKGKESVTLRNIAAKLDIQAPALYWHFKNKKDLTDDMAQAILSNAKLDELTAPADINNWPTWLADLMHCLRNAVLVHRDGARTVAGANWGYTIQKFMFLITRVLEDAGFDRFHASMATGAAINYVWGFVIEEQAGMTLEKMYAELSACEGEEKIKSIPDDQAFLIAVGQEYRKHNGTEIFDWGLQVIITGLKSHLKDPKPHKIDL
jgi:TetR/AcrR family transcriptional regulator, tetracycline repressor protein